MTEMVPTKLVEALEGARHARAARRSAEIAEVVAVARAAEVCGVSPEDVTEAMTDQIIGERMIQAGAEGTPYVSEFLALELGAVLEASPEAAFDQLATVLNVQHRHPVLWEAFLTGRIRWGHAARVASECRMLTVEAAAEVDRKCAHSLAQWPISRVMYHLKAWIIAADPALAAKKKILAESKRQVEISQFTNAECQVWGRLSAQDGVALDHALDQIAATLPAQSLPEGLAPHELTSHERASFDRNMRRSKALGMLARRAVGQEELPQAQVIVRINADDPALHTHDGGISASGAAHVQGWGELLTSVLPEFLAGSKVTVRPVLVPSELPAADQHDPSALMRLAVCERNPVEAFPYGTRRSSACQLDHTDRFVTPGPPGQTHAGNLGPLGVAAHRSKTHGDFHACQPSAGWFHWFTRAGYEFLVGPSGTQLLSTPSVTRPPGWTEPPERAPDPPPDDPAWDIPPRPEALAWTLHVLTLPPFAAAG
ncbi:hypothetical protein GCM10025789_17560 [Tessaracoccus lubricantis]|uniref:DUF222 domain-containing protein n=1 Tax=Tessaracoccus lubricantis TaxID=545543 RepID=A0ABP9FD29_9ACTN